MASMEFTPDAEILSGNLLKYEVSTLGPLKLKRTGGGPTTTTTTTVTVITNNLAKRVVTSWIKITQT